MTAFSWKVFRGLAVLGTVGFTLFGLPMAFGWALGCLASFVMFRRTERFWTPIISAGHTPGKSTGFHNFAGNYGIMFAGLLLAALFPRYLNIYTCALGMMMIKITSVISALLEGRKGEQRWK